MSLACCYLPLEGLAGHLNPHLTKHGGASAVGSIWATDVPGWITAIGTAGLLIGAIVTAMYAIKAFRKQSQEVTDQAEMLRVQSGQLEEQRKINALQAKDLEESLRERARLRRITEREQADAVLFEWWPASHVLITAQGGGSVRMAGSVLAVRNASRRRIINATCRIEPSDGAGLTLPTEQVGALIEAKDSAHSAMILGFTVAETVPLMRPGARFGFLVRSDLEAYPDARLATRFTDDAGLHWQIDQPGWPYRARHGTSWTRTPGGRLASSGQ
jgi:hypothetical protein